MLSEMGDESFCLGHVLEDSYHAIMSSPNLLEPLEQSFLDSVPMCSDCVYQPFCGADPVFHHATQKNYIGHKPTSEFCARNMAIFRRLLSLMRADDWTANLFMR